MCVFDMLLVLDKNQCDARVLFDVLRFEVVRHRCNKWKEWPPNEQRIHDMLTANKLLVIADVNNRVVCCTDIKAFVMIAEGECFHTDTPSRTRRAWMIEFCFEVKEAANGGWYQNYANLLSQYAKEQDVVLCATQQHAHDNSWEQCVVAVESASNIVRPICHALLDPKIIDGVICGTRVDVMEQ